MKGLTKILILALVIAATVGTVSACSFDLVEKDASWNTIPGGDWGNLNCSGEKFVFNGKGLTDGIEYSLISYAEPYPGIGSKVLGTDTANGGGNVHIDGDCNCDNLVMNMYPTQTSSEYSGIGAKIWLVPSSNLEGGALNAWNPSTYLFETELIRSTECGDTPPIQAPEFPSLALPAAMVVGMLGIVFYTTEKKKI